MFNSFNSDYKIPVSLKELGGFVNYVSIMEILIFFATLIGNKNFQGFDF